MSIVTNPELRWDGETEVRAGRHIERPSDWTVTVSEIDDQPPPWIHHKAEGFNLDANHIRAKVVYAQDIVIPAGEHFVIVQNTSHLTWGSDDYTVAWRVEITMPTQTYRSADLWCDRKKGDQSFAVGVKTAHDVPATLRVVFWTKWADTNGSVNLRKIDIQPQSWGLPVRDILRLTDDTNTLESDTIRSFEASESDTGSLSQAFGVLSAGIAECAHLADTDADPDTLARCLRKLSRAFREAADMVEKSDHHRQ